MKRQTWYRAVVAGCLGAAVFVDVAIGAWTTLLGLLPAAVLYYLAVRSGDNAFRSGWIGAAHRYDVLLTNVLSDEDRALLLVMVRAFPPSQAQYQLQLENLVAEIELLENPSPDDILTVYRRHIGARDGRR